MYVIDIVKPLVLYEVRANSTFGEINLRASYIKTRLFNLSTRNVVISTYA